MWTLESRIETRHRSLGAAARMATTIGVSVLAVVAHAAVAAERPADAPAEAIATERVIVELKRTLGPADRRAGSELARRHRLTPGLQYTHVMHGFAASMPSAQVAALRADPAVEAVYPDDVVTVADRVPTGVRRIEADSVRGSRIGTRTGVDVDIAIVDTGIDAHPDLTLVGGVDCSVDSGSGCRRGHYNDGYGHGTHVAGTAAAKDNGRGIVGVAPGARTWSVKVFSDDGYGTFSSVIAGLDWIVRRGTIEVANLSLAGGNSTALSRAVSRATAAGVVVVAAAGNGGESIRNVSPANAPNAITVSAYVDTDGRPGGAGHDCNSPADATSDEVDDTRLSYSNHGPGVDFAAPGGCIRSTWRSSGTAVRSGTSMAAPHVAGAAAVYLATRDTPRSPERWRRVRDGMRARWGTAQTGPCGFQRGVSDERVLIMGGCKQ